MPVVLTVAVKRSVSGFTVATPVPVAVLPVGGTSWSPVRVAENRDASVSKLPPHAARRSKDAHVIHHAASHFLKFFMGKSPKKFMESEISQAGGMRLPVLAIPVHQHPAQNGKLYSIPHMNVYALCLEVITMTVRAVSNPGSCLVDVTMHGACRLA
jgi:hypothetical protein